jgi:hypothetical protein
MRGDGTVQYISDPYIPAVVRLWSQGGALTLIVTEGWGGGANSGILAGCCTWR